MSEVVRFRYPKVRDIFRQIRARTISLIRKRRASGNVIMFHSGRSGSTLLGSMLDQHPQIFWDGETIERYFHKIALLNGTSVEAQFGARSAAQSMQHIARRMDNLSGGKIYGLEIQPYQLEMMASSLEDFMKEARRLGFDRIIILDRNHDLRKIVSHFIATNYRRHHVKSGLASRNLSVRINPEKIFVDHRFHRLDDVLKKYEDFFNEVRKISSREGCIELDYDEDISGDPQKACTMIFEFLKLNKVKPKVLFSKTADFPLEEMIENYSDIREFLRDTRYAWMAP